MNAQEIISTEPIDAMDLITAYRSKVDGLHSDLMAREALIVRLNRERTALEQQLLDAGIVPCTKDRVPPEPELSRAERRQSTDGETEPGTVALDITETESEEVPA